MIKNDWRQSMAGVCLVLWVLLLSLAWIIPYHFPPWLSFHLDAWMGMMLMLLAFVIVARSRQIHWSNAALVAAVAALIPWLQLAFGLIPFAGEAWTTSLYLVGAFVAVLVGYQWERGRSGAVFGALGAAILVAAFISVALQLIHWLKLVELDIHDTWSMGLIGERPYANLGQPNQLATLLAWSLLAILWFYVRGVLSGWVSWIAAAYVLLGIALTQSRTGAVQVSLILLALMVWGRHFQGRKVQVQGCVLIFLFGSFVVGLPQLREMLLLGQDASFERFAHSNSQRFGAWKIFSYAVLERPWGGFGWTSIRHAQLLVADNFPPVGAIFSSSHNLVLDIALWLGLPIATVACALLMGWIWLRLRAMRSAQDVTMMLFLLVILIHALLEFPLQYAYMLVPAAMVCGALDARLKAPVAATLPRLPMLMMTAIAAIGLVLTVRDYLRVEQEYVVLRMETAQLIPRTSITRSPTDLLVLTQFGDWFRFARFTSHSTMSEEDIEWLATVSIYYPTPSALFRMAVTLVLNGRAPEASIWLKRLCATTDAETCASYRAAWEREALTNKDVAKAPFPPS